MKKKQTSIKDMFSKKPKTKEREIIKRPEYEFVEYDKNLLYKLPPFSQYYI